MTTFSYNKLNLCFDPFSVLITFNFLESLWHKEADCIQSLKKNLHIFSFSQRNIFELKVHYFREKLWDSFNTKRHFYGVQILNKSLKSYLIFHQLFQPAEETYRTKLQLFNNQDKTCKKMNLKINLLFRDIFFKRNYRWKPKKNRRIDNFTITITFAVSKIFPSDFLKISSS